MTATAGSRIKVRYDGFDARWDEWVELGSTRIAPHLSKAKGGRESRGVSVRLKVVATRKNKRTGRLRRVFKQGFLVKQGKRFKSYKTRYFTLCDDGTMAYYKKMTDQSPASSFSVKRMVETRRIAYPKQARLEAEQFAKAEAAEQALKMLCEQKASKAAKDQANEKEQAQEEEEEDWEAPQSAKDYVPFACVYL